VLPLASTTKFPNLSRECTSSAVLRHGDSPFPFTADESPDYESGVGGSNPSGRANKITKLVGSLLQVCDAIATISYTGKSMILTGPLVTSSVVSTRAAPRSITDRHDGRLHATASHGKFESRASAIFRRTVCGTCTAWNFKPQITV